MSIFQFAFQSALFTKLSTDSNLTSTLGATVRDDFPDGTAYPFVQIGNDTAVDYSTKTEDGSEVTVNIDVWSRFRGSQEIKNIMDRIHSLLHNQDLTVSGTNLINLRFEFADAIRDPDGITRHGIMRFRAVMLS